MRNLDIGDLRHRFYHSFRYFLRYKKGWEYPIEYRIARLSLSCLKDLEIGEIKVS